MLGNIEVFDLNLSKHEMKLIDSLDKGEFLNYTLPTIKFIPKNTKSNVGYTQDVFPTIDLI